MAAGVTVLSGLAVGLLVIPSVAENHGLRYSAVAGLVVVFAAALSPPVLTRLVDVVMRIMRRPPLERPVTWPGMLAATGWSLVSWLAYGISVWVLAVGAGAPAGESFLLCLGGTALAMTAGFLVFLAPSGIGIREAVLVAALVAGARQRRGPVRRARRAARLHARRPARRGRDVLPVRMTAQLRR